MPKTLGIRVYTLNLTLKWPTQRSVQLRLVVVLLFRRGGGKSRRPYGFTFYITRLPDGKNNSTCLASVTADLTPQKPLARRQLANKHRAGWIAAFCEFIAAGGGGVIPLVDPPFIVTTGWTTSRLHSQP